MQFVKTFLVSLICGAVGLGAIAFAVMGMMSDEAEKKIAEVAKTGAPIRNLRSKKTNRACIDALTAKTKKLESQCDQALAEIKKMNFRAPLMKKVFPSSDQTTRLEFGAVVYKEQFPKWLKQLRAGDLPDEADIREAQEEIERKRQMIENEKVDADDEFRLEGGGASRNRRPGVGPGGLGGPGGRGGYGPYGGGGGPGMMPRVRSGGGIGGKDDDPAFDPQFVASVEKARNILTYVDENAFHKNSDIIESDSGAAVEKLWYAQMTVWVQDDIIRAITKLNNSFAQKVEDGDPYVEHVPVKRIESIRVHGYRTEDGMVSFPLDENQKDEGVTNAFTDRESNKDYDVIPFSIVLWVDQREVPSVLDAIYAEILCVNTSIEMVKSENAQLEDGYMFGTAPVIKLTLDFEAYFFRDVFVPIMPDKVQEELGIKEKKDNQD